ncbi:DNA internalization-related competence protein ComEC/Rec2 [Marinobacterium sediminicola]|uniref:Competence protein ComEC n=1 Tax=Marinobacterium sediminicola TaxID=518898 RepID=A0ABY1RX64_9GAMM|nr:DNA internalization-related competence protein ComEC/Rec2 [Marinobacterium sediminicola]ULG67844.1 DNA internalization-related competence protein ComEC/Rec2 [Marinobacterium sediminicola]SMR71474.1 competence protein ComEC [Marinobacterium sediminicola]
MIAYLFGILAVTFVPALSWAWLLLALALPVLMSNGIRRLVLPFVMGLLVATLYGHWQLAHRFEHSPSDYVFTAEIVDLPRYQNGRYVLLLKPINSAELASEVKSLRLIRATYYGQEYTLYEGDELEMLIRLKSPGGLRNPSAFDLERYYLANGIDARGYIKEIRSHLSVKPGLGNLRQRLASYFEDAFPAASAVMFRALVLGDRSQISPDQWRILQVTGTAHLFVVSGLHVAVVAALGWGLGRLLQLPTLLLGWRHVGWYMFPSATALLIAGSYAWLSGWGIPVQRAWLMLAVFVIAGWMLRPLSGWERWKLALVVIVSLHPLAVLEAGLWLSFGAVALILLMQGDSELPRPWSHVELGARLQLMLFVGMLPLMASVFNQFSLLSIPVNLVAVPMLTLVIWSLPVVLLLPWIDTGLTAGIERVVEVLWQLLFWCGDVLGLHAQVAAPGGVVLIIGGVAVLLLLLPIPLLYRMLVVPLLVPLLSVQAAKPSEGHFRAWLFDVGQGQAVLVETAGGAVLYDTGPGYSSGGAAFGYAVQPMLVDRGIRALQALIVSHGDSDHAGGYEVVRQYFSYSMVYAGEPELTPGAMDCSDQQWQLGGVSFGFLRAYDKSEGLSSNNRSCILRVENGTCSLLITGDLDMSGEYKLLSGGHHAPVTWLVAGHHGSRDSTTGAILDLLAPEWVLISAGKYNRFGHPHKEVIAKLEARDIPWMVTANAGAIEMVADMEHCSTQALREQEKRYWTAG